MKKKKLGRLDKWKVKMLDGREHTISEELARDICQELSPYHDSTLGKFYVLYPTEVINLEAVMWVGRETFPDSRYE